ncbi:MAG: glycine cleavage system protein H [Gemmatales bacterium]|nr:glycine cleavage system protein H [Gemmatales bacterium]MDW7994781.1 glycine cleavage system protein H [Gemmatales bacterium]
MDSMEYLQAPGGIRIAADRWYHRHHYWILSDTAGTGHYKLGLTAYVCRPGIEVYFVEQLPQPGTIIVEGGLLGVVETEKAVVSIYSPVLCRVEAVNRTVLEDPNCLSFDNYRVWLIEFSTTELPPLLSAIEYCQYLQELPPPQCIWSRA